MTEEDKLKELVAFIASQLVDNPDQVEVHVVDADRSVIYELAVAQTDLGKIIGKDGRTARAIRTLLSAAAPLEGKRPVLEILE